MKSLKKFGVLTGLLLAVTVRAQTPAPAPAPIKLSLEEMKTRVETLKARIADDQHHVMSVQAAVRRDKDVVKLTCVNDKLIQIKAQMDLFDNAKLAVESGTSTGNDAAAQTAFVDVEKSADDIQKLRQDADACAGELDIYKQESKIDVERPPNLDDPTDTGEGFNGNEDGPDIDVPAFATPFS